MAIQVFKPHPELPPPKSEIGMIGWLKNNLFYSPFNTLLTLSSLYLIYYIVVNVVGWLFIDANWIGETREACDQPDQADGTPHSGACWVFISVKINQLMYGFYPATEQWRPNLVGIVLVVSISLLLLRSFPKKIWLGAFTLTVYPIASYYLIKGGVFGLTEVQTAKWGGLMLTLILSFVGIIAALPLGTIMALGRRSKMPIVKSISITYIEFWRGVPLITVLFMASVMLPLFLPEGVDFDKLIRAFIGIVLFQTAYMAEVVRGGLQAIPMGQYEAADAMGLSYWKKMNLIVLPQALKLVIPGIVNTFIALFKDTTLVYIVGLFDLLHIAKAGSADTDWLGFETEGYVFCAFIYWIFCYSMSHYSQHLERKLDTGLKN